MMSNAVQKAPPGPQTPLTLAEVRANSLQFITDCCTQYGDIFRYQLEDTAVTVVNSPQAIKHVLQTNNQNYIKKGSPDYLMHKHILGDGLLTSEGEQWLKLRRMTEPAFHQTVIAQSAEMMVQTTQAMLAEWCTLIQQDKTIDMVPAMSQLTLKIVTKALFNYDISSNADSFGNAVNVLNETLGQNDFSDPAVYHRMPIAIRTIQTIVAQMVAQRREETLATSDFLQLLLTAKAEDSDEGLTDRQVRDQIITLLLAGHETTAKALSWTLYLISQHPDVERQLIAEIESVLGNTAVTPQHLPQLPTVWQTIQESLRLYPPVWVLSRIAVADDDINGFHIPANSTMLVSPYALHRHPAYWPEPARFLPQRFAEEQRPFTHIPFGAGPRLCIGRRFASLEMQLVLITILQQVRFRLLPDHPVEPQGLVSLNPRYGLPMTVFKARRSTHF